MSGGVLEVLLVKAEGLKHARLLGSKSHVIIECGVHTIASKFTTDENGKAWWNEKFSFALSYLDLKKLTRMRLRIIGQDKFFEDYHIGEATIHLMDVLKEGNRRGSIELKPTPYNVVLKDQTYRGEIKVGVKFISNEFLKSNKKAAAKATYDYDPKTKTAKEVGSVNPRCSLPEMHLQTLYQTFVNLTLRRFFWPRLGDYFMNISARLLKESEKAK